MIEPVEMNNEMVAAVIQDGEKIDHVSSHAAPVLEQQARNKPRAQNQRNVDISKFTQADLDYLAKLINAQNVANKPVVPLKTQAQLQAEKQDLMRAIQSNHTRTAAFVKSHFMDPDRHMLVDNAT